MEVLESTPSKYAETLERARKESPALIKRLSNKITGEDKARLTTAGEPEFNPVFEYPGLFDLSSDELTKKRAIIRESLSNATSIEAEGYRPLPVEVFDKEKAETGLLNIDMIVAAQAFIQGEPEEKNELATRLKEVDRLLSGSVDVQLFHGIINSLREIIEKIDEKKCSYAKKIADELMGSLPGEEGDQRFVGLPKEVFEQYRQAYSSLFSKWLEEIVPEKEGTYSPDEMLVVFKKALASMGLDKIGWTAEISEDATSLKISMEDRLLTVPADREPLTTLELRPKVFHEVIHIARGWNGSSISRTAEHGMPDYLDAEEGLASYSEQFISGKPEVNSTYVERYLGIGHMTGTLSGEGKDFSRTFAVMWRARALLDNLESLEKGVDIGPGEETKARKNSLMNAQRIFRGGDGSTPGVGWTKDKAYYEGQAKLTDTLIRLGRFYGLEYLTLLFTAKFDPTNSLHNQYLGLPFKE